MPRGGDRVSRRKGGRGVRTESRRHKARGHGVMGHYGKAICSG